jgi:hypothetical protein
MVIKSYRPITQRSSRSMTADNNCSLTAKYNAKHPLRGCSPSLNVRIDFPILYSNTWSEPLTREKLRPCSRVRSFLLMGRLLMIQPVHNISMVKRPYYGYSVTLRRA